jgi:hypothetical protein
MKALQVRSSGGLEVPELPELPDPMAQPGEPALSHSTQMAQ